MIGLLEFYSAERISGWARLPLEGADSTLSIFLDGKKVGEVKPDSSESGGSSGGRFSFALDLEVNPLTAVRVEVVTTGSGKHLQNSPVRTVFPSPESMAQVIVGKDDWLFLANDSNRSHEQMRGEAKLGSDFGDRWERFGHGLNEIESTGVRCFLMVVPNKECIYRDEVSPFLDISQSRPLFEVEAALSRSWKGFGRRYRYPIHALTDARYSGAFPKGDTHWSTYGAWLAFRELFETDYPEEVKALELEIERAGWADRMEHGDLVSKMGALCVEPKKTAKIRGPKVRQTNGLNNSGSQIHAVDASVLHPRKILFIRDSFGSALMPFVGRAFGDVMLSWTGNVSKRLLDLYKPDVIFIERVERFLVRPSEVVAEEVNDFAFIE
ncbi:hypothetical protein ACG0Z6_14230 [Roseateles sp. BYS180W]|uniref:AlgX/AlgJ SGNH hydrolase-like domain-containing protein n=1 Tax=Roseateles rivi TaxID=3299028 RepID=A0ABW7FYK1_9BURK